MAGEYDKLVAIRRFLQRVKTAAEIKQIALDAFAAIQDGVTVTSVSFEGGSGTSQVNCEPHILLNACESILVDLGDEDAVAAAEKGVVFTQFSGGFIQT